MKHTKVITRRGGSPQKAIDFLKDNPEAIKGYKVVVLHVGTNCFSTRHEWGLYLQLVNEQISQDVFDRKLTELKPPEAIGTPESFKDTYQKLIDLVRALNKEATVLVSAILPRFWDHPRRHLIRKSYNRILEEFNAQPNVFFIYSYRPFFDRNQNLKQNLFEPDGHHLSQQGAVVLRMYLCEKIDKALKGLLK